ncbi:hypothetical protein BAE44_0023382 [Dichanthelium oligosanthes]|uniref:Uncharacterized protein n=1 Tax=Dichanthelium oligosanthes TaxID=888268 RepID=A0A1E5URT1_9POAL|nr:hypothetical protein BAE44_0023382 [Dichanthelium oligosanthes]
MAKKSKNPSARRAAGSSSSSSSAAGGGDDRAPWLRLTAFAVLTAHSAFSAYLARDDARLVALVAVGYLLMLVLLLYGGLPLPGLQKRD